MENEIEMVMENERLEGKKAFKRTGYALFAMLIAVMFMQVIVMVALELFAPGMQDSPWYLAFMLGIPLYLVGFPIFLLIMRKIPNGPKGEAKKMSLKNLAIMFTISMGGSYIFNLVGLGINTLISSIRDSDVVNPLETMLDGVNIIPIIIFVVILSPIVEEIIFRGVILNKLRIYGERRAIWFTALTFALFHGNLSQFFYAFILGLIFGYVAIKTNTIRYAVILHIGVNLFGSLIMPALALSENAFLANIAGLMVIIFMFAGVILFVKNYKKIDLEPKRSHSEVKVRKRFSYGNSGMIFYYIACLGLFVSVILA